MLFRQPFSRRSSLSYTHGVHVASSVGGNESTATRRRKFEVHSTAQARLQGRMAASSRRAEGAGAVTGALRVVPVWLSVAACPWGLRPTGRVRGSPRGVGGVGNVGRGHRGLRRLPGSVPGAPRPSGGRASRSGAVFVDHGRVSGSETRTRGRRQLYSEGLATSRRVACPSRPDGQAQSRPPSVPGALNGWPPALRRREDRWASRRW